MCDASRSVSSVTAPEPAVLDYRVPVPGPDHDSTCIRVLIFPRPHLVGKTLGACSTAGHADLETAYPAS